MPYLTQAAAGLRGELVVFGDDYDTADGTCVRDFIHVVDLAKAHVRAIALLEAQTEANYYEVFNVGTGNGNTVLELIEAFEKANGIKLKYRIGPRRAGDVEKIWAQADKANTVLGWKAEKTLADSLRDAWRWQLKLVDGEAVDG